MDKYLVCMKQDISYMLILSILSLFSVFDKWGLGPGTLDSISITIPRISA